MTSDRWRQIAAMLEEARSLPTAARAAFLQEACGSDADLRHEVDSLLNVDEAALALLEQPFMEAPDLVGKRFGAYRLVRELGRGGMGTVYLAEQDEPHVRRVAIKLVNTSRPSAMQQQRFALEQEILGRLNHSAIAKLYQSGLVANGPAYFVMEYIEGAPITDYCDQHRLNLRERIELVMKVCDAVAHVHLKGVVHRDLKPSNILVQSEGEAAQPKIIDFGIAKDALGREDLTREGAAPGTLRYMSPEQAGLSGPDGLAVGCDFRTDVYALGVVLYELLVGKPPLTWPKGSGYAEVVRLICEETPLFADEAWRRSPTAEREALARRRGGSSRAIRARLGGDLRWILARALAKRPEDRYPSPRDFSRDLQRLLHDLPVEARRPHLGYILGKFVKRHLAAAGALGAVAALVPVFVLMLLFQQQQTALERDRAHRERDSAEAVTEFLVRLFHAKDPYKKHEGERSVTDLLQTAGDQMNRELESRPHLRSRLLGTMGRVYHHLGQVDEGRTRLEQALEDRAALAETAPEVLAGNLRYLAQLDQETGRYQQAEAGYREAANLLATHFGRDHLGYLEVRNLIGHLQFEQGLYEQAEPLLVETLAALRDAPRVDDLQIGRTLNNLAVLKQRQGKFDQAEVYFRDSLAIHSKAYGASHPLIAVLRNNLAAIHFQRGEYGPAEAHYRASLEIKVQRLGWDHPSIANSLNNLAVLHQEQGRWALAVSELCRAIHIREQHTEQVTLTLAQGYINLGRNQTLLGQTDDARASLNLAHAMITTAFGTDHPQIPFVLNNLARNEVEAGFVARAEALFRAGIQHSLNHQRTSEYLTAVLVAGLADTLSRQGRHAEALYQAESALGFLADIGHEDHWMFFQVQTTLGEALAGLGRFEEAEPVLREAYAGTVSRFGADHWKTGKARAALSRLENRKLTW
ncbi:serine/threonine-protein kinase [Acanthopleuribacter pedis]|uniref:Serine/threonine protein kinase n=1 Tax=Acanthopleuribacter pedis TaxID=442870 RepID=A0A8J7U6Y3_9BACT|nr:serine/threonine-protein kinase [Acanthopleuribacter pedis]MBO1322424.1 serine/threonine protein kinase [Acanthopleuribacter pedis]